MYASSSEIDDSDAFSFSNFKIFVVNSNSELSMKMKCQQFSINNVLQNIKNS